MSQSELREELLRSIRRFVVGPYSPDDVHWTGLASQPTVVDASFDPKEARPIGPWVGSDGEEILDNLPTRIYLAGIVYPVSSSENSEVDQGIPELPGGDEEPGEIIAALDSPKPIEDESSNPLSDGEEVIGTALQTGRSTMSFTVCVPAKISYLDLQVDFGAYSPIEVAKQTNPWWKRRSCRFSLSITDLTDTTPKTISDGPISADVGIRLLPFDSERSLITVWLSNVTPVRNVDSIVEASMFQTRLSASFPALLPYPSRSKRPPDEMDLLYRNVPTYAIGHGTDVSVHNFEGSVQVHTETLSTAKVAALTPDIVSSSLGRKYAISMIGLATFDPDTVKEIDLLLSEYSQWINAIEQITNSLDGEMQVLARANVVECQRFLNDMIEGWELINRRNDVRLVFCDVSLAMNQQRIAYSAPNRILEMDSVTKRLKVSSPNPHSRSDASQGVWRPFQIAFILANLSRIVHDDGRRENEVDLIWMPTGGGKTEAYLGLSAFVILWTRQLDPTGVGSRPSTKVLMRYTYRLLTIQQLVRAASLICALEKIRERNPVLYGTSEIRIGCWLGNKTTPGTVKKAVSEVNDFIYNAADWERGGFVLTRCPWCGCSMGQKFDREVLGYRKVERKKLQRILLACPAEDCEFSYRVVEIDSKPRDRGIPLLYCDEDVYDYPPDFVVGTIDKVAMMAWRPEAGSLFGLRNGRRFSPPPTLFIQDELHLLTGALGSLDGMYEAMLEELCRFAGGRVPMIVASSATTRNYRHQVEKLYGKTARIVPPLGIDISDSFFAVRDDEQPGRIYAGVASSGYIPNAQLQTRIAAAIGHFVPTLTAGTWSLDPYWTNVLFFSSRRSLARMMTTVDDSLRIVLRFLRSVTGLVSGPVRDDKQLSTRGMYRRIQITATSSEDVNEALNRMQISYGDDEAVDICFATSMIEVGLDVPRLGLMTVMGQPKSASQYIQVTGRVGRSVHGPALVFVVLNHDNVRDLSHYETFSKFHERLYASVEPASVTPYTMQALGRTARGCSAIVAQVTTASVPSGSVPAITDLWKSLRRRRGVGPQDLQNIDRIFEEIVRELKLSSLTNFDWTAGENPLLLGFGDVVPEERIAPVWWSMRSMRSVDADALASIFPVEIPASVAPEAAAKQTPFNDEVEDL